MGFQQPGPHSSGASPVSDPPQGPDRWGSHLQASDRDGLASPAHVAGPGASAGMARPLWHLSPAMHQTRPQGQVGGNLFLPQPWGGGLSQEEPCWAPTFPDPSPR